jgi:hypothetical protein
LLLYMDDILIMSKLRKDRHWAKGILEARYEKVSHAERTRLPYLGMTILRTTVGFKICMRSYIEDILKLYGKKVRDYLIPASGNMFIVQDTSQPLVEKAKFHLIVTKLLYLGKRGRPDVLLPVQFLCTRVKSPDVEDAKKLERVLGYLSMTHHWTRAFDNSPFDRVQTYIDASFATHCDGKSQSGCMVMLGNTLVHEACQKQKLVTKSSTEAELVVLSDYLMEGELIKEFLMDMGTMMDEDLVTNVHLVFQDNQSAIALVKGDGGNMRSKYMKVRREYVKERLGTGEVEIEFKPTGQMIADVLTKPLGGEQYHILVETLLGKHRFVSHSSNRGVKEIVHAEQRTGEDEQASCEVVRLPCTNHEKKQKKNHTNGATCCKQRAKQ